MEIIINWGVFPKGKVKSKSNPKSKTRHTNNADTLCSLFCFYPTRPLVLPAFLKLIRVVLSSSRTAANLL